MPIDIKTILGTAYVSGYSGYSGYAAANYAVDVGDNSATSFTVTHNLNQAGVTVTVRDNSTGYYVYPDIKFISANTIVVEFISAPSLNQYKVVVFGTQQ